MWFFLFFSFYIISQKSDWSRTCSSNLQSRFHFHFILFYLLINSRLNSWRKKYTFFCSFIFSSISLSSSKSFFTFMCCDFYCFIEVQIDFDEKVSSAMILILMFNTSFACDMLWIESTIELLSFKFLNKKNFVEFKIEFMNVMLYFFSTNTLLLLLKSLYQKWFVQYHDCLHIFFSLFFQFFCFFEWTMYYKHELVLLFDIV